jgi:hypothetical protein
VAEEVEKALAEERDAALIPIGNLVPDSVPVDDDEVGKGSWLGHGAGGVGRWRHAWHAEPAG